MGVVAVMEESSSTIMASGGRCVVMAGMQMMHQWCVCSWTVGSLTRFPLVMNMALAPGRHGQIKLNAVDSSQHWPSVHKHHLQIKFAMPLQLLGCSAQVGIKTNDSKHKAIIMAVIHLY